MQPLSVLVAQIRADRAVEDQVPDFDPADGGIEARVLLLLEAPGRKALQTGFVSRDNPDPTARNLRELLAPLPRHETVLWNIVPWYVGTDQLIAAVSRADLACSRPYLERLFRLLPALAAIVLLGKAAQSARYDLGRIWGGPVVDLCHPSGRVRNRWPERWADATRCIGELTNRIGPWYR